MNKQNFIDLEQKYSAHNYHPLDVVLCSGKGVYLYDVEGKKYLDMMSAYSAVSHGHSHPEMVKAVQEQVADLAIVSRAFYTDKLGPFVKKICDFTGLDAVLPMNTGTEAVETALKAARRWGYNVKNIPENKAEIIVAAQNFHGRSISIVSFSSEAGYKAGFGPLTPGFKEVPFNDAKALEEAITEHTCAFLVEPVQGEAGINVPNEGYLKQVRDICDKHNVLLLLDEIQAGLGRTGKNCAYMHEGILPDGLMLGKALGGGMLPISAFVAKKELMDVFDYGSHGSTFGGNPLAAAVGLRAIELIESEKLSQQAFEKGAYFMEKLKEISHKDMREVRGKGLLIGIEFNKPVRPLCEALKNMGMLCKETHETVIRFAPPLVISYEQIDEALRLYAKGLEDF